MTSHSDPDRRLAQARELVRLLEAGDDEQAERVLHELADELERPMFEEVGRLTREVHEAVNDFLHDERLHDLANHEIKDAAERLRYVISMTEESANTTLGVVEAVMPVIDDLEQAAARLHTQWQRFRGRDMKVDEFRAMTPELAQFLERTQDDAGALHVKLNEVLMAQGFQDLTGQIIRKVIRLVQDVEAKLVHIVRLSGIHKSKAEKHESEGAEASGPAVPGVDKGDVVHGQDEVDDLLSSLGF